MYVALHVSNVGAMHPLKRHSIYLQQLGGGSLMCNIRQILASKNLICKNLRCMKIY